MSEYACVVVFGAGWFWLSRLASRLEPAQPADQPAGSTFVNRISTFDANRNIYTKEINIDHLWER